MRPCATAPLTGIGNVRGAGPPLPASSASAPLCEVFPLWAGPRAAPPAASTAPSEVGQPPSHAAPPGTSTSSSTAAYEALSSHSRSPQAPITGSPQMPHSYGAHLHDLLFRHQTHLTVKYVARSFYNVTTERKKNKLMGHAVVLDSAPADHVTVVAPPSGCGSGRGATVDETARTYHKARRHDGVHLRCPAYASEDEDAGASFWDDSMRVSVSSEVRGCRLAVNAGLFNVKSFACHGGLVSDGRIQPHTGGRDNLPALAILSSGNASSSGGWGMAGYLTEAERLLLQGAAGAAINNGSAHAPASPWSQLVSGLGWLVRRGSNYIRSGVPQRFEDGAIQETTHELAPAAAMSSFIAIESARTGIGFDASGRLVIGQIDGRSWWHGIDLLAFSDWMVELGAVNAINVDGGASATMVRDGIVINDPTYACGAPGAMDETAPVPRPGHVPGPTANANATASSSNISNATVSTNSSSSSSNTTTKAPGDEPATHNDDPNHKCKRPVSSVLCLHDSPPPPFIDDRGRIVVHRGCVCLDLYSSGAAAPASASTRFSWDAFADLVHFVPLGDADTQSSAAGSSSASAPPASHRQASEAGVRRRLSSSASMKQRPCLCSPPASPSHPWEAEALPQETYTIHVPVGPGLPRCLSAGPLEAAPLSAGKAGMPGIGGSGSGGGEDAAANGAGATHAAPPAAGADTLLALSLLVLVVGLVLRWRRQRGLPLLPPPSAFNVAALQAAAAGALAWAGGVASETAARWRGGYTAAPVSVSSSPRVGRRRGGARETEEEDEEGGDGSDGEAFAGALVEAAKAGPRPPHPRLGAGAVVVAAAGSTLTAVPEDGRVSPASAADDAALASEPHASPSLSASSASLSSLSVSSSASSTTGGVTLIASAGGAHATPFDEP